MERAYDDDLRERLMNFSLAIWKLCSSFPNTPEARLVRGQLFRSGPSGGAQYREACRARSSAEFISKIESSQQELDETSYWLELLERSNLLKPGTLTNIRDETEQLIKIFAASARTAKANR
jgi:four helix bundle protein